MFTKLYQRVTIMFDFALDSCFNLRQLWGQYWGQILGQFWHLFVTKLYQRVPILFYFALDQLLFQFEHTLASSVPFCKKIQEIWYLWRFCAILATFWLFWSHFGIFLFTKLYQRVPIMFSFALD